MTWFLKVGVHRRAASDETRDYNRGRAETRPDDGVVLSRIRGFSEARREVPPAQLV